MSTSPVPLIAVNVLLFLLSAGNFVVGVLMFLQLQLFVGLISVVTSSLFIACTVSGAYGAYKRIYKLVRSNHMFFIGYAGFSLVFAVLDFMFLAPIAGSVQLVTALLAGAASVIAKRFLNTLQKPIIQSYYQPPTVYSSKVQAPTPAASK